MSGDSQATSVESGDAVAEPSYSYRPSATGSPLRFVAAPDALEWYAGRRESRIPYAAIRRVRLSFRPQTMQTQRFCAEIWSEGHPKLKVVSSSWKSMFEQAPQGDAYARFIVALHRQLAGRNSDVVYQAGTAAPIYWAGVVLFAGCALAMAALIVLALQAQVWSGAVFIATFLALFLWQSGSFLRRNRPGRYQPENVPAQLLPGGM